MSTGAGYGPGDGWPPAQPVSFCYRHPTRQTAIRCIRCERPICPECMRPAAVGFQCPDDVRAGRPRASVTAVGARVTGLPPLVTLALFVANVALYLATALPSPYGINQPDHTKLFGSLALYPFQVAHGGQYYRLLTGAFLHVALWHIAVNMISLVVLGPPLERLLGWWRFAGLYLLSAVGGSAVVYILGDVNQPVAGASGALYGLFAAAVLLTRELGLDPQWVVATIVINVVATMTIPNISLLGHLGGALFGAATLTVIAGLPWARRRIATGAQIAGMAVLGALIVVLVVVRTAALTG